MRVVVDKSNDGFFGQRCLLVDCGPSTLAIRINSSQVKLATVRAFGCEWRVWRVTATMMDEQATERDFSLCRSAHTPRRIGPFDISAARRDGGQIPRRRLRLLRTETGGCFVSHDRLKFVPGL